MTVVEASEVVELTPMDWAAVTPVIGDRPDVVFDPLDGCTYTTCDYGTTSSDVNGCICECNTSVNPARDASLDAVRNAFEQA